MPKTLQTKTALPQPQAQTPTHLLKSAGHTQPLTEISGTQSSAEKQKPWEQSFTQGLAIFTALATEA